MHNQEYCVSVCVSVSVTAARCLLVCWLCYNTAIYLLDNSLGLYIQTSHDKTSSSYVNTSEGLSSSEGMPGKINLVWYFVKKEEIFLTKEALLPVTSVLTC